MKKHYKQIIGAAVIPALLIITLWLVHFFNLKYPEWELYKFGVLPQKGKGLLGILTSPFIHDTHSWSHIINNSPPLFVLLWLTIITYKKEALKVLIFIWVVSGIWVWMAARENYHIGASGIVYGLAFFLFFSGIFKRSKQLMGISLLVAFLYGSMVWGLFPFDPSVSHEAHIFGAIAGIVMAVYLKNKGPEKEKYDLTVNPEFEEFVDEYNKLYYLDEYWSKQTTTQTNEKENFDVFFEYIRKEKKAPDSHQGQNS